MSQANSFQIKRLIYLCLVPLYLLCGVQISYAQSSPVIMLQETSDTMIDALKQNHNRIQNEPTYVYDLARKIILPHVDTAAMSRLALGRDNWKKASPKQRKKFIDEFTTLMIRTYSSALAAYTDQSIKFRPIRGGVGDRKRIQVDSLILQQGGPSIPVNYRLVLRGKNWKVYDMTVDGVSMVQSFRSQFSNEISKGGMDGLLSAMEKHRKETK